MDEPFDIITLSPSATAIYDDYHKLHSGLVTDPDVPIQTSLRAHYPQLTLTAIPTSNLPLLSFAAQGHAVATLDTQTDSVLRWRGYLPPAHRGGAGRLGDAVFFAKYRYEWAGEDFILYTIGSGIRQIQYVLKEPGPGEDTLSHCAKTDKLISAAITAINGNLNEFVYVFDQYWTRSRELWLEVQKSSWDKVILDSGMKRDLQDVSGAFFDSKELYERYGVPWKRGLLFTGPPGNGKTISIKALMKTLYDRRPDPIPTLYVKNASQTYHIKAVFQQARQMTPCLLVLEDIETIVTPITRSYFLNELDGLANNGGMLLIASTNYPDRLDPGLSQRPSRFDRKFNFPLPNKDERILYAEYWRQKLQKSQADLPFPRKLCEPMAEITDEFSFAYLQEAFVASLLTIARQAHGENSRSRENDEHNYEDHNELSDYKLWVVFEKTVKALRKEMDAGPKALGYGERMEPPSGFETATPSGPDTTNPSSMFTEPPEQGRHIGLTSTWREGLPVREMRDSTAEEPSVLEMARGGVVKVQNLAESAFMWC